MAQRHQVAALTQCPAADVLNTARAKLTVWVVAAGVGQKGWKAAPSSALLESTSSYAPCSKCQTQEAVAAQRRLCSTWNLVPPPELRLTLEPHAGVLTGLTVTHDGSKPIVHVIFGCALWQTFQVVCFTCKRVFLLFVHCMCFMSSMAAVCLKLPSSDSETIGI